jgi:hypothetical protein
VVCIPARDEVRTTGAIVPCMSRFLESSGLVEEVVVDDGSKER